MNGRQEIVAFLTRKWLKELDYRLIKELWAFTDNRIAVRFAYEWHDDSGNWFRSYGNENWEFDNDGLMRLRLVSSPASRVCAAIGGLSLSLHGVFLVWSYLKLIAACICF
jgi:nuclear transport factor 2 (NTF2) superfamily protein